MRKIWLALAAFALLGGITVAASPAHAAGSAAGEAGRSRARQSRRADHDLRILLPHLPALRRFRRDTYPKLKAEWVDTGKAKIVYRDYPLDQNALKAAMVARCAPPERYAAFVEVLFKQQTRLGRAERSDRRAEEDRRARRHRRRSIREMHQRPGSVEADRRRGIRGADEIWRRFDADLLRQRQENRRRPVL